MLALLQLPGQLLLHSLSMSSTIFTSLHHGALLHHAGEGHLCQVAKRQVDDQAARRATLSNGQAAAQAGRLEAKLRSTRAQLGEVQGEGRNKPPVAPLGQRHHDQPVRDARELEFGGEVLGGLPA